MYDKKKVFILIGTNKSEESFEKALWKGAEHRIP
jgi:hypothetical protein